MSVNGKFRYSLDPVLKTRKWERDALQADLVRINDTLAAIRKEIQSIQSDIEVAAIEWKMQSEKPQHFAVDRFAILTNYMRDLGAQRHLKEKSAAELEAQREALIDQVTASQRGVEAVERHREQKKANFDKLQLSEECKIADDQWSTLQHHVAEHNDKP
ncbi:MAG: hypothetical protein HYS18_05725 [Burkholderiales bacterium]|nr:hypothetical protein [Burkholderiales bacterium]